MSYSTKHKMVLQSMMWSKCLLKSELVKIFKELQISEGQIDSYISLINSQIDQFNLSISRGIDGDTGDVYYALICISENIISKFASVYTVEQLEVLKSALDLIITKNGRFKAKKVVNMILRKNIKFPSIEDIYGTINEFVKENYFKQVGEYFHLKPRGLIEFTMYFRTYYTDYVKECTLCKAICIRPVKCHYCSTPFHKICADRFSNEQEKCISCNNNFELLNESVESVASEDNPIYSQSIKKAADWLNAEDQVEEESDYESLDEAVEVDQLNQLSTEN